MVIKYFMISTVNQDSNPELNCFSNWLNPYSMTSNTFTEIDCHWNKSSNTDALTGYIKTQIAELSIYIGKTQKGGRWFFEVTVLGGDHPLSELARLCKKNGWNAYDIQKSKYLDVNAPALIKITETDRKEYNEEFDNLLNGIPSKEKEDSQIKRNDRKPWWQFWT